MRRVSPAVIITSIALFISLGGVAIGASRYVLTSKSQISPKALSELRAATRGKRGPAGPRGLGSGLKLTYLNFSVNYVAGDLSPITTTLECPPGSFPLGASTERGTQDTSVDIQIQPHSGFGYIIDNHSTSPGMSFIFGVCAAGSGLTGADG